MIVEIQFRESKDDYFNITMFEESGKPEYCKIEKIKLIDFIRNNNKIYGPKKNV